MNPPLPRVDALAKVTGQVRYGADWVPPGLAHAALTPAAIGKGRVVSVETAEAEAVPGVLLVLTRLAEGELTAPTFLMVGGDAFESVQPLLDDKIAHRGQPIALVVAETPYAAAEAAALVRATYEEEPVSVTLDDPGVEVRDQADVLGPYEDRVVGDADAAYAASARRVDAVFDLPTQHPVPMELTSSVVYWDDGGVTVHEGTQNASAIRRGLAGQLGLPQERVRVVAPYVGGGFGNRNSLQMQTGLAAVAARRLGRPVKLVVPRELMFHNSGFRPASRHRIRLGAGPDGRITALLHDVDQQTSRYDVFPASYTDTSARVYAVPAFRAHQRIVFTDSQTPGYMRAPYEHPAVFALESAMDELASATGLDPVELRLLNDTETDPLTGLPFSSRHLAECLRRGADRFGWARRTPQPGSMRADDGSLVGWGVASAAYKASAAPALTRLRLDPDGGLTVWAGAHEMGQGIRTAIVETVVGLTGMPAGLVTVEAGDTVGVPHQLTAGSWGTATVLPGVYGALEELRKRLGAPPTGPLPRVAAPAEVEVGSLAPGQPPEALDRVIAGGMAPAGPVYPDFTAYSFAAHFVEVRVEPTTRRVRVARTVSVVDCGRVASPVTAASQVRGGVVWGIGAALREHAEPDPRFGGFANADLEGYTVPVNADIPDIDLEFIDEPDPSLNALGVKGLGEVSMVGVAAAVANAVHHATGYRARRLPIRIEDLL
ncbi:xanthine dehydrogenase family protein molybdopterin-binding subunit [Actinocorallia sp. A-T 12471]|uniref:xanthine dehydrogenase family protein molybdopterin-binding subunit n=1 Tax=Actinocorallia sp. A-T 12471 TaxID=3089813 RepID=UPI0029D1202A|nr:xanthine dehydrogenase family protein molybdopterin-binding subunit [Actinocorallia sp. A-T 12471]MDX6744850.1 xanthine dehydrogenase family protein molybdopterin-binding subunit [Actinocorallia sp. A-T 12471]